MLSAKSPTYCDIYLESIQIANEFNYRMFSDRLNSNSNIVYFKEIAGCHLHSNEAPDGLATWLHLYWQLVYNKQRDLFDRTSPLHTFSFSLCFFVFVPPLCLLLFLHCLIVSCFPSPQWLFLLIMQSCILSVCVIGLYVPGVLEHDYKCFLFHFLSEELLMQW